MKRNLLLTIVTIASAASLSSVRAGDISGTIKLKGTPPAEKQIDKSADKNCGPSAGATTHHYIVGPNGEFANVVVALKGMDGKSTGASAPPVVLDQLHCEYTPVIMAVQTGQKIAVKNSDPTLHNVHAIPTVAGNTEKNQAQPPNAPDLMFSFPKAENFLKFQCDVHNWMLSWVSVFDHPYFAVTDANGAFTIDSLAPGTYKMMVWHEGAQKPVEQQVQIAANGSAKVDVSIQVAAR